MHSLVLEMLNDSRISYTITTLLKIRGTKGRHRLIGCLYKANESHCTTPDIDRYKI